MPNFSNLSITIRRCYLMSSTIIGFARVEMDHHILLKEIPIFHSDDRVKAIMDRFPVAICSMEMDRRMLNDMIWSLREVIEQAIVEEWKKKRNGTVN